ncbi:MAG: hypothetical protein CVU47_10000 [Chloroflexi bacterium HGW-Chloroflexi-9]|nr:MAG: hypothetical protein CVU47_10000 [Chloroflexi bacterium HGW-Chloroflexi-9]
MARLSDDTLLGRDASEEGEDDLSVGPSEALLTGSDWTVGTLLGQLRTGRIELSPNFQRREAWDQRRKSKFIESLLLNLPIPQIVLAERRERRGSYLVIDGKQRLLAVWRFGAGASDSDDDIEPLRLTGLDIRKDLNGKIWSDFEKDPDLVAAAEFLENQTIRTVVIKNWPDADFLHLVFHRLNTGSVTLSPQELRQALHPGPFVTWADEASASSKGLAKLLGNNGPDFRMRDVELLVRYFAFTFFLADYRGNLKKFLDDACDELNKRWNREEASIREELDTLDRAIEGTFAVFGDDAFMRWGGSGYEGRFNRAVFDIMVYYFRDAGVARRAVRRKGGVKAAFQSLCDDNSSFVQSIQTTTKTALATHTRLSEWGLALERVLEVDLPVPSLEGERVKRIVP